MSFLGYFVAFSHTYPENPVPGLIFPKENQHHPNASALSSTDKNNCAALV